MQGDISKIKTQVHALGRMVETAISRAITALRKQDVPLAEAVIAEDEQIDRAEVELEKDCIDFLERQHRCGADLRFVLAVLKINDALERVGDLAENIAEAVTQIKDWSRVIRISDVYEMAQRSQDLLKRCLDAFLRQDIHEAQIVINDDEMIDEMRVQVTREIVRQVINQPDDVPSLLLVEYIIRQLERIGDQATNIAEDIIYLEHGEIVRHPSRFRNQDILQDKSGRFRRLKKQ